MKLSKREYFSAMAMQGFISHLSDDTMSKVNSLAEEKSLTGVEVLIEMSIEMADELLKQLEK